MYNSTDPVYEKRIRIRSEQVDMTRFLRMSELFRLLEEASIAHTEALGCTKDKTLDRGLLWVITRQQVEIESLPAYDDEIIVRSWQGDMQHVFFPRFYEIEREGRVIVRGQALWMLIDEASRSMIMPEDYGIEIPGRPGAEDMIIPAITIPKIVSDEGNVSFASTSIVTHFSRIDINGHMNNTRYFDIIDDVLHLDSSLRQAGHEGSLDPSASGKSHLLPKKVLANYLSELRLGDTFDLNSYKSCSTLWFEGTAGAKTYFRIRYEY